MRAATRPGGDHGGRHHRIVLATFRPTWRQALARGLGLGALGTLAMAPIASVAVTAPALAEIVSGTALRERALAHEAGSSSSGRCRSACWAASPCDAGPVPG
jgi:hypothetical protein